MATKTSGASKKASKKGGAKKGGAGKASAKSSRAATKSSNILSPQLNEVIGRALTDSKFRGEFFKNRSRATRAYSLSAADKDALANISSEDLEQHAEKFSAKSALRVVVKVTVKF
jgi:hypothetical protein